MKAENYDVAVIGGGPAGLAAAVAAREEGAERVVLIERDAGLGGILQQCIHPGFGLKLFSRDLTGPEYAGLFADQARQAGVEPRTDTTVLAVGADKVVRTLSPATGPVDILAKAVVLAMGCRERTRFALSIPGGRPAGVYTAGAAQRLVNIQGHQVGREIVILGSGDIGMIMARRLTLEGARVKAVVEIMPYLSGLVRNRVQCLDDFDIPLMMNHTITNIHGRDRVRSVDICPVDDQRRPILEKSFSLDCDTVLLSVGLIPENELSRRIGVALDPVTLGPYVNQWMQTSVPGVFAAGNVLHVNDLVDNVSLESRLAGRGAAAFAAGRTDAKAPALKVLPGVNVRYVSPQSVAPGFWDDGDQRELELYARVTTPLKEPRVILRQGRETILQTTRRVALPAEMLSVKVELSRLQSLEDLVLDVTAKE